MDTPRFPWNDAMFGHLLQRYRNTYHEPETAAEVDQKLLRILEHVDGLVRQARGESPMENDWLREFMDKLSGELGAKLPAARQTIHDTCDEYLPLLRTWVAWEQERATTQARLDERTWLAHLPDELEERITHLLYRLPYNVREGIRSKDEAGHFQYITENATTYALSCIRLAMGERDRQARLDEHRILAGLDAEGKKQRYLELNSEE